LEGLVKITGFPGKPVFGPIYKQGTSKIRSGRMIHRVTVIISCK